MTERTSHLAGLWIGAAISNTSHSNKAGFTTVKRARLTGKGSRSTAVLPQKHKKFPYRPTRDVSLLSRHASYVCICVYMYVCMYVCTYVCMCVYIYSRLVDFTARDDFLGLYDKRSISVGSVLCGYGVMGVL